MSRRDAAKHPMTPLWRALAAALVLLCALTTDVVTFTGILMIGMVMGGLSGAQIQRYETVSDVAIAAGVVGTIGAPLMGAVLAAKPSWSGHWLWLAFASALSPFVVFVVGCRLAVF